ncbi:hypothetical protein HPB49_011285 [Dermacentor silvarum]|uniref:Uncharacterized protein n=1 Tax=Dermacentor silvarum TaxID=543639 RepID=A0ACB8CR55_DERSI|nr:hypothetical protein HPB49_011285 [Dermacentor silvarum]
MCSGNLANSDGGLGQEFSGKYRDGRRVMGLVSSHAMATVVAADPQLVWSVPEAWSLEEAATIPLAYTTAYYALLVRGNVRPGDCLLVHPGRECIGQAAIFIALSVGCTVFSTFSTREEYQFLKSMFPCLEDRHFIRSDDLYLDEQILKETGGRGANVVLNICNSEKLEASACSLACRGCVISVETYRSATKSSTRVDELCDKLKGVNVVHVEPDVLHLNNASALEDRCRVAKLLNDGIASGAVKPLISTCFPRDEAVEAFRLIANGNSKGKVLIQVRSEEGCSSTGPSPAFAVEALPRVYLYESKTYIIVGGLSDIGLELAEWLIDRGCRKLLLNSPFGGKTGFQRFRIHKWQRAGVTVLVSDADTSTKEGASKIVQEAAAMGPVGGIYILLSTVTTAPSLTAAAAAAQGNPTNSKTSMRLADASDPERDSMEYQDADTPEQARPRASIKTRSKNPWKDTPKQPPPGPRWLSSDDSEDEEEEWPSLHREHKTKARGESRSRSHTRTSNPANPKRSKKASRSQSRSRSSTGDEDIDIPRPKPHYPQLNPKPRAPGNKSENTDHTKLLQDVPYTERNADELDFFIKLKVDGTIHLDELSRKCCPHLDHFLVFSSLCSSCGSPCDPYSGYADSVVERICENRAADELPGLAIQWGALEDGSPKVTSDGTVPQRIRSCLDVIERFLGQSHPVVSSLVRTNLPLEPHKTPDKMDLVCSVARVFGFRDPMNLDPTATLGDLGMDSAMGVDVQQLIEEECGLNLSVHEIRQLTIDQLLNIGGVKSDCAATLLKRTPTGA